MSRSDLDLSAAEVPMAICTRHGNIVGATDVALSLLSSFGVEWKRIPFSLPRGLWDQVMSTPPGEASVWHPAADQVRCLGLSRYRYRDHLCVLVFKEISEVQSDLSKRMHLERLNIIHHLTATVAHELRSPLGSIIYDLESLLASGERDETHEHMLRAAEKMKLTIERLMGYAGQEELAQVDLEEVCEQVSGALRSRVRIGGHHLSISIDERARYVLGERLTLEMILVNLVLNALESSTQPVSVEIVSSPVVGTERVCVSVRDNGAGVEPSLKGRIFEPFFSTKEGAVGMGLVSSRDATVSLGGALELGEAETGTVFHLWLSRA